MRVRARGAQEAGEGPPSPVVLASVGRGLSAVPPRPALQRAARDKSRYRARVCFMRAFMLFLLLAPSLTPLRLFACELRRRQRHAYRWFMRRRLVAQISAQMEASSMERSSPAPGA